MEKRDCKQDTHWKSEFCWAGNPGSGIAEYGGLWVKPERAFYFRVCTGRMPNAASLVLLLPHFKTFLSASLHPFISIRGWFMWWSKLTDYAVSQRRHRAALRDAGDAFATSPSLLQFTRHVVGRVNCRQCFRVEHTAQRFEAREASVAHTAATLASLRTVYPKFAQRMLI